MSNIYETIEIKSIPNEESGQMVGAEIILTTGEEIVAIDVPEENQICGNEFNTGNKKSEDFTEGYIVMLGDGTFKLLQAGDIANGVFPDESTSMGSTTEPDKSLEIVHAQIPLEGCDKKLVSTSELKRKHNGLLPHECDFCQKNFSTGYALKAHKRTHTGEKPYICPEISCQKRFKTSGDLQKHIRTHTGERPFKCGVCSKAFTTSNIRKVHMRVHTGEKPYECTHKGCERRFSSATNYRNHLRIHTGEKPYVCSVQSCQKRFTEYSSLYKHYTVHSQKKRYECSMCSRQYRQLSTLNIHINTIHKEKVNIYERNEDLETANGIRPTFFKPINPAIKNPKPNVISQHFVLHPKNGMLSSDPKEISFKGANGEDVTSQQFMELQVKRNSLKTDEKKSEEINFVPVNDSEPLFISSPTSTDIKNSPKTPLEFEPLKAMTRGAEAILVLTVPNDNGDPIQDH